MPRRALSGLGAAIAVLALVAHAGAAAAARDSRPSTSFGLAPGQERGPRLASAAATAQRSPAGVRGIDVSSWQGRIRWRRVAAAGFGFAFLKASEGTAYVDATYARNRAAAEEAGLEVGAYDFARPAGRSRTAAARAGAAEARFFLAAARPKAGELRPVLDLETTGGLGPVRLRAWVQAWASTVGAATRATPTLYTSPWFWRSAMADTQAVPLRGILLWIAHWTGARTPDVPASNWAGQGYRFWQWSDCGRVAGIRGCVDQDVLPASPAPAAPTLGPDATPPSVPALSAPLLPVQVRLDGFVGRWHAVDAGSGVRGYEVQYRATPNGAAGGGWATWRSRTWHVEERFGRALPGAAYCIRARARDWWGNVSAWSAQRCTAIPIDDRALADPGRSWRRLATPDAFMGTQTATRHRGARLVAAGLAAARIALLVTRCPRCGAVSASWNGVSLGRYTLAAARVEHHQLLLLPPLAQAGSGTLVLTDTSLSATRSVLVDGIGALGDTGR